MSNLLLEYCTDIWYVGDWIPLRYTKYHPYLVQFEKRLANLYPIGDDYFKIDHGKNYFNFFRRIGEPFYYCIFDKDKVVGTVCYVKRKINNKNIFYLCDLKFDHSIRSRGFMKTLLVRTIPTCLFRGNKFYAISMNDDKDGENKIKLMGKHLGDKFNVKISVGCILNIYSLEYEEMLIIQETINKFKNKKINYVSLNNIKDIILQSTQKPMKLLHVDYDIDNNNLNNNINININPKYYDSPQIGFQHMFCTDSKSMLSFELEKLDIKPTATATVIHYNMYDFNWEFIKTSEI